LMVPVFDDAEQGEEVVQRFSLCGERSSAMSQLRSESLFESRVALSRTHSEVGDAEEHFRESDVAELSAALDVSNRLMESLVKRVSWELSLMHLMLQGRTGYAFDVEDTESESDSDTVEGVRLPASQTSKARKKLFSDKSLLEWFNEQKHLLSMTAPVVPAKSSGGLFDVAHARRRPVLDATTASPRDQSSCFHLSEMRLGDIEAQLMKLVTVAALDQERLEAQTVSLASCLERLEALSREAQLHQVQCCQRFDDMEASLSSQTSSLWSKGSHKTVGYPRPSSELHPDHIIASQKYEQGVCGKVDHCIEEGKEGQSFVDVRVCLPLAEQENPQI